MVSSLKSKTLSLLHAQSLEQCLESDRLLEEFEQTSKRAQIALPTCNERVTWGALTCLRGHKVCGAKGQLLLEIPNKVLPVTHTWIRNFSFIPHTSILLIKRQI